MSRKRDNFLNQNGIILSTLNSHPGFVGDEVYSTNIDQRSYKLQRRTWRAAAPTRHVSTCHLTIPPALTTRSLSSRQLAM